MSIIKATLFEPYLPSSYDKPEYQSTFLPKVVSTGLFNNLVTNPFKVLYSFSVNNKISVEAYEL